MADSVTLDNCEFGSAEESNLSKGSLNCLKFSSAMILMTAILTFLEGSLMALEIWSLSFFSCHLVEVKSATLEFSDRDSHVNLVLFPGL